MRALLLTCALVTTGVSLTELRSWPFHPASLTAQEQGKCPPLRDPRHLPSVDEILDSARFVALLDSIGPVPDTGSVLLSIANAKYPGAAVRVIDNPVERSNSDTLVRLVEHALRATREFDAPAIRLRLSFVTPRKLHPERSTLCPPTSADAFGQFDLVGIPGESNTPQPVRIRHPVFRLRIGVDGTVLEVLVRSSTGVPELDGQIAESIRRGRYHPALLDGVPAEVWLEKGRAEVVW